MSNHLPGAIKYPGHDWGILAEHLDLEIGATGQVWADAVRNAWIGSGGSSEAFEKMFPDLAIQMKQRVA